MTTGERCDGKLSRTVREEDDGKGPAPTGTSPAPHFTREVVAEPDRSKDRHRAADRPHTKLKGPVRGKYFDCYVMIDIYSRMIVGAHVHHTETAQLAVDLMTEVFGVQGVPAVVHADRGTSMTSKSVATLLDHLQVTRSHSRPRVSNDNPFSEAWNKTLKYAPPFPERFTSCKQRGCSSTNSSTTTTTITGTPGSGWTPPRTSTTASPRPPPNGAPKHWPQPAHSTPPDSPPNTTRRSSTSPLPRGSTSPRRRTPQPRNQLPLTSTALTTSGPRNPIHLHTAGSLRRGSWAGLLGRQDRGVLGQRSARVVLGQPQSGVLQPAHLAHPRRRDARRRRLDQTDLQPPPTPLIAEHATPVRFEQLHRQTAEAV